MNTGTTFSTGWDGQPRALFDPRAAVPLPEGVTLRVWAPNIPGPVFESRGHWLHPLFELGDFLAGRDDFVCGTLVVRDRVVGRAAAFLMVRLGLRTVGADVVSRRAQTLLDKRGIDWVAGTVVDRIACRTEDLLAEVTDEEAAWDILAERRKATLVEI